MRRLVCRIFFLARNFVSGSLCALETEKLFPKTYVISGLGTEQMFICLAEINVRYNYLIHSHLYWFERQHDFMLLISACINNVFKYKCIMCLHMAHYKFYIMNSWWCWWCVQSTNAQIKVFSECCPMSSDRIVEMGGETDIVVHCFDMIWTLLKTVIFVIFIGLFLVQVRLGAMHISKENWRMLGQIY